MSDTAPTRSIERPLVDVEPGDWRYSMFGLVWAPAWARAREAAACGSFEPCASRFDP